MKSKTILSSVLVLLVFTVSAASASELVSAAYLVPEASNLPEGHGNDTTVGLNLSAIQGIAGWDVIIGFDRSCINITDVDFTGCAFTVSPIVVHYGNSIWISAQMSGGTKVGELHLADLTIRCDCSECTYCESPLTFEMVALYDDSGHGVPGAGVSGTFTCGGEEPPEAECLGTCCNDSECNDPFDENVPCKQCIDAGKYWHPNEDESCFGDATPSDLCIDWCPECCDGVDNDDTDTDTDFPADRQCPCGLSPSEETGGPPIPELPTLALAGIGILGAILLARKRE